MFNDVVLLLEVTKNQNQKIVGGGRCKERLREVRFMAPTSKSPSYYTML